MKRKLILCLPGNEFDGQIMVQTIQFINWCAANDWDVILSVKGGSNVSFVRELCLGIKEEEAMNIAQQVPFNGRFPYDYILWVDSDIAFTTADFQRLVDDDKDIVAGVYKKNAKYYTSADKTDENLNFMAHTDGDIKDKTELIDGICFGFGFVLIKQGVFEKISRPWFLTSTYDYKGTTKVVGEDVYFCLKAQDAGFKTWIDPRVKLVHVKKSGLQ